MWYEEFMRREGLETLTSPVWEMHNHVSLPTKVAVGNGVHYEQAIQFVFVTTLLINDLFEDSGKSGRSIGDDQLNIFHSIESSLSGLGIDGRSCLLRLICELQSNPIGQFTIIGEILSVLFTPKRGLNDFLHEYLEAEVAGRDGQDCADLYHTCPFSMMNAARKYHQFSQGYSSARERPQSSANTINKESQSLPKIEMH
ncbi:unnamed protein product [Meganyctiphanes norvegica]|uniref:Uncharacterized protein n=1 Tax=Meganyctiphanes norvegica TaxID=48144 RepID=A0AAV2S9Y0_MEGNR